MPPVELRGPQKDDIAFIMDSWLGALRYAYQSLPDDLFFPAYRQLVKRVLAASQVRVLTEGGRILGYVVSNDAEGTLQWLYLRKQDEELAKLMLSHLPPKPDYTFRTKHYRHLLGQLQEPALRLFKLPPTS